MPSYANEKVIKINLFWNNFDFKVVVKQYTIDFIDKCGFSREEINDFDTLSMIFSLLWFSAITPIPSNIIKWTFFIWKENHVKLVLWRQKLEYLNNFI